MKCPKCDADLTQEDDFCPDCGTKVEKEKPQKEEEKHIEKEHHKKKKYLNEIIFSKKWIWIISAIIILVIAVFSFPFIFKKPIDNLETQEKELPSQQVVCDKPYIRVGTDCCLDKDDNKICDKDEKADEVEVTVATTPETSDGSTLLKEFPGRLDIVDELTNIYFFEVNRSVIDDIKDSDVDVVLTIEFVDDKENKRADLDINDRLSSIDQEERTFTLTLNDGNYPDFIEEGNNFIEIRPKTRLDILELKVEMVGVEGYRCPDRITIASSPAECANKIIEMVGGVVAEEVVEEEVIKLTIDKVYTEIYDENKDLGSIYKITFTINNGKNKVLTPILNVYSYDSQLDESWETKSRGTYTGSSINPGGKQSGTIELSPKTFRNLNLKKSIRLTLDSTEEGFITAVNEKITIS